MHLFIAVLGFDLPRVKIRSDREGNRARGRRHRLGSRCMRGVIGTALVHGPYGCRGREREVSVVLDVAGVLLMSRSLDTDDAQEVVRLESASCAYSGSA